MNFKGFKKISSDDKCTKLIHDNGHELKIAHSALSQKHRKELEKLPVKMADGGGVVEQGQEEQKQPTIVINAGAQPQQPQQSQSYPVLETPPEQFSYKTGGYQYTPEDKAYLQSRGTPVDDGAARAPADNVQQAAQPQVQQPVVEAPQEPEQPQNGLAQEANSQDDELAPAAAPQQAAQPDPQTQQEDAPLDEEQKQAPDEYMKSYADYKNAHQQQFAHEDAAFQHDLQNGHITPETYSGLFAKKDTLGKVGTIFGLMLSGMGSGLSGQPNAVLAMMDQQIKNDLDAQKTSKENAQNYFKLNLRQQLQGATIGQMKTQNQLTGAQAANTNQDAQLKAYNLARIQMNLAALHNQKLVVDKMPDGPMKQKAMQTLAMMGTAVNAENANISDVAASKLALLNTMGGNSGTALRLMGMKDLAEDVEGKTIPGHGKATRPVPENIQNQIVAMDTLGDKAADLMKYSTANFATLSPAKRAVAKQKAEEFLNFYNTSIQGGTLTEGRLAWLDDQIKKNPTGVITQLLGNQQRLAEMKNSNDHRRDIILKSFGAPISQSQQSQSGSSEGQTSTSKSGKPIIYKNGKWIYK